MEDRNEEMENWRVEKQSRIIGILVTAFVVLLIVMGKLGQIDRTLFYVVTKAIPHQKNDSTLDVKVKQPTTPASDAVRKTFPRLRNSKTSDVKAKQPTRSSFNDSCSNIEELRYTVGARQFSCASIKTLETHGFLEKGQNVVKTFKTFNSVFIAASSPNHFAESLRNIASTQHYFPNATIVFYDLGLSSQSVSTIKQLCNIDYRIFDFRRFPSFVKNLWEYRWKPLIIMVNIIPNNTCHQIIVLFSEGHL